MQRSDALDEAFLALSLSDRSGTAAMETDACEPCEFDLEPPAADTEFNWSLAAQFRKLNFRDELDASTRAIASSSVNSDDMTMDSCAEEDASGLQGPAEKKMEEEADDVNVNISLSPQERLETEIREEAEDEPVPCEELQEEAGDVFIPCEELQEEAEDVFIPCEELQEEAEEPFLEKAVDESIPCEESVKNAEGEPIPVEESLRKDDEGLGNREENEKKTNADHSLRSARKPSGRRKEADGGGAAKSSDTGTPAKHRERHKAPHVEKRSCSESKKHFEFEASHASQSPDNAASPPQRRNSAASPQRRRNSAASPPQRRHNSVASPPQRRRNSAASPPQRRNSAASPPQHRRNSASSSPHDSGSSSGSRTARKRSLDLDPAASCKRACPQSDGLLRVSLRAPAGHWLQPADVAVLFAPFCFPYEPRLLFMDATFASGSGWEGPGRPRQLVVPLTRRRAMLEFYEGRSPRVWPPVPHHATEVASLESWRLQLEALDDVPEGFLPRRLSQLPPEKKHHFEGALRWASIFARTSRGLLHHLQRCARVPRPRSSSEDLIVELRVENGPEDQVVLHAVRRLIQGLAPTSGLIFRSRGDAPGWVSFHVVIAGELRDALVLIAATNRRSLVLVRDTATYMLASGGLSRVQSFMAPPNLIRTRFSRSLGRLGPKNVRLPLLQNLLQHLLASRPNPVLPACCMDLVVRLGVCADDAMLAAKILVAACRALRDYGPEIASGCLSGFQLESAGFMCCVEDAGLIEMAAQLIYCPCSTCTPFLYEHGPVEPPTPMDLL